MNFFLLTSEYPPISGGGISTYCFHTARMMAQFQHKVTVFTVDTTIDEDMREQQDAYGIRTIRFRPGLKEEGACLGPEARLSLDIAEAVAQVIQKEGPPDLIESQEYLGLAYFLLQRRWTLDPVFQNIPVVLTLHTPQFVCTRYNQGGEYSMPLYWIGEMERFCLRAADGFISPSQYLRNELLASGDIQEDQVTVIRYPFKAISNENNDTNENASREIIYVGRVEPRKGVFQMLDHFQKLWLSGKNIKLQVIGGDTYYAPRQMWVGEWIRRKYARFIDSGLLDLQPSRPQEQLYARLREVGYIIVPSTFENFPFALLEPMSIGVIPIVSSSGGQAEIVQDGISGFVFSHARAESFQEKLLQALQLSDEERNQMRAAARQRITELCQYEIVYRQKIQYFEKVLRQQRKHQKLFPFTRHVERLEGMPVAEKKESGLLSIVIPFYNAGSYLEDALRSLATISYPMREIIVVDDGSDDPQSLSTLEELSHQYSVRVVRKENGGLASARNAGAAQADGEFLAFLDADDTVEPAYYSEAVDILKAYDNVSFVGCWAKYWGNGSGYWPAWNAEPPYLLIHNTMVSGSLVYKTADFQDGGKNDPGFEFGLEDYDSVISMVEHGYHGVAIPKAYFNYRVRPDSMSHQITHSSMIFSFNRIANRHKRIFALYASEVANLINANGPGYLFEDPTHYLPAVNIQATVEPLPLPPTLSPGMLIETASAKTLFYFAVRKLLFGLYTKLGGDRNWLFFRIKRIFKSNLLTRNSE